MIKVTIKDNGYKAERLQDMIRKFERAAAQLFPGCTMQHFYYGDGLSMTDLVLGPSRYAHFNIAADRVSLGGYTCSDEDLEKRTPHSESTTPTGSRGAFCHCWLVT